MDFLTIVSNYGFPIAVAIFLLFEYREIRKEIMNEIHGKLVEITESQKVIAEMQKQVLEIQKQILETQKSIMETQKQIYELVIR